jgi:SAM-dependent methyltransferase
MSRFAAEWLALRERHDVAARSPSVLDAVTASLKSAPSVHVVDLACGSGSTLRALHSRLPARQHWDLVDNDPDLLAIARSRNLGKDVTLNTIPLDLSRSFETALGNRIDLITISALLDLVSETWLHRFLRAVAARALPVYAALTYDGRTDLSPADPLDTAIVSAVNAHQRTDKGFGPALGPSAAGSAIAGFESLGYSLVIGESDWAIEPDDREMQKELLEGWAHAAGEMGTLPATEIFDWLTRRKAAVSQGVSSMRVGHVDFFAFPSSTR